ncbi:envelope stress response membrane protein PspC [Ferrimonas sediminicola]|uniref:Envelope stress response membrane protein PspC n=1 Tax=Ferrimonas sediminicola TaxID=2569538 RepID=A0A4U1B862_9GAMM|nr:envelope stress response membrane protein PspC [Ferrimonas sediminicola]TKB46851.1 envelope stress response membrane protein PspC [Ferrimonas sediminicola]
MKDKRSQLVRLPDQGKVAGVCAGIAEHFNLEVWLVRIVTLSAILLTGIFSLPLLLYIIAWVLLDKGSTKQETHQPELKTKVWQAGDSPQKAMQEVSTRFRNLELRLRRLEKHVTSDAFHLKREIDNL